MERNRRWLTRTVAVDTAVTPPKWRRPAASHRRIADQGEEDRRLPGLQLRRRILPRPYSRPARVAADVPAKYKSEPWARLGVNVDHDFEPLYIISPDKRARSPNSKAS